MRLIHPVTLFVLLKFGIGMVAPEFAAAQPMPPPIPGRPPARGPSAAATGPNAAATATGPSTAATGRSSAATGPNAAATAARPNAAATATGPNTAATGPGAAATGPSVAATSQRAAVAVPRNWPLIRPPRFVIVRPPQVVVRSRILPRIYLPPVVFGGVVVGVRHERRYRHDDDHGRHGYSRDSLVWQETETLYREDEWTDFTLHCNARGSRLWFEVLRGNVQADWAEVVFENGEVQVIEFPERLLGRGIYELLDFRDSRRVAYVRMVAQTTSREARLTLWLER